MNITQTFHWTKLTATLALPLLLVAGCQSTPKSETAVAASGAPATATKVTGGARFTSDNATWRPLRAGTALTAGTLLQTAVRSTVEIVAGESRAIAPATADIAEVDIPLRNRILLAEDSVVQIEDLLVEATGYAKGEGEIRLNVRMGRVMCASTATVDSPVYEVRFATGIARGRAATFVVQADGVVQVLHGAVAVSHPDGTNGRAVSAGNQLDTRTGQLTKIGVSPVTSAPVARPAAPATPRAEPGPPSRKY
ncbi:MAG: hypothetical protein EXS35_11110 [Pedosphaera sp.]|nr:hypothetical protein [Pedosphaera sp.]